MTIRRLAWIIGTTVVILILNVGLSLLYIAFYSYFINPGHDEAFYQEYAKTAAPYCSIITGIPVFYFVCRWISGKWESNFALKAALLVWFVYVLIDLSVLTAAGFTQKLAVFATISLLTKLASAYLGGLAGSKKSR
jgi:hypothetical protein